MITVTNQQKKTSLLSANVKDNLQYTPDKKTTYKLPIQLKSTKHNHKTNNNTNN